MLTLILILIAASFLLGYVCHRGCTISTDLDLVTGLPSRAAFQHCLQQQLNKPGPTTLVLIDLNDFKAINDRHGHLAGDQVLATVAGEIKERTESLGTLFRWGGDEFAVIVESPSVDKTEMEHQCHTFFGEAEFPVGEEMMTLSCSIGWARSQADDTVETLFQRADEALYRDKTARQLDDEQTALDDI